MHIHNRFERHGVKVILFAGVFGAFSCAVGFLLELPREIYLTFLAVALLGMFQNVGAHMLAASSRHDKLVSAFSLIAVLLIAVVTANEVFAHGVWLGLAVLAMAAVVVVLANAFLLYWEKVSG